MRTGCKSPDERAALLACVGATRWGATHATEAEAEELAVAAVGALVKTAAEGNGLARLGHFAHVAYDESCELQVRRKRCLRHSGARWASDQDPRAAER